MIKIFILISCMLISPDLSKANILDGNKARGYLSLAEAFFNKIKRSSSNRDYSKVNDYIQKGLNIAPNNFMLNYRFGVYLSYQNEYQEALKYFNKALKIKYSYYRIHYNLSEFFLDQKNPLFNIEKSIFHGKISLAYLSKEFVPFLPDTDILAKQFDILAQAYFYQKNLKKAFTYTLDAIRIVEDKNYKIILEDQAKKYTNIEKK